MTFEGVVFVLYVFVLGEDGIVNTGDFSEFIFQKLPYPFYQMKPVFHTSILWQRQSSSGWVVLGALASSSYPFSAPLVVSWGTLMWSRKILPPDLLSSVLLFWSLKTEDPAATLGQLEGRRRKMGKGFMFIKDFKSTECFIWIFEVSGIILQRD